MRYRTPMAIVLAAALVAAACGSSEDDRAETTTSSAATITTTAADATLDAGSDSDPTSDPDDTDTDTDTDTGTAASPVRRQLDWVVSLLESGELADGEAEARFSPVFLAQVPPAQLVAFLPQITTVAAPPYEVERIEESPDGLAAEATVVGGNGGRLNVQLSVGAAEPHLIDSLLVNPGELSFPQPIEIGAIDERLAGFGPQTSLGLYDVTSDECVAVHELRTDETIVLGSVFKLWVLAALADEIDQGRATWDETVPVTDALRSNLAGEIYLLDTGTEVSLERLAEAMIAISDNTATDLLLDRLGRETVEAAMVRSGVADPSANVPMLSTGNLFTLKYAPDPPNAVDYRSLDEAGKRSLLTELDRAVNPWVRDAMTPEEVQSSTNADGVPITEPRDLDIEWFATAEDLCRTLVELDRLAGIPGLEPVAPILEANPGGGLPFDRDRWPTIRFKGGSEAGVVAGAWWFEAEDGTRHVVAGGVSDPDAPLDEIAALLTLASAIELVR